MSEKKENKKYYIPKSELFTNFTCGKRFSHVILGGLKIEKKGKYTKEQVKNISKNYLKTYFSYE